MSPYEYKSIVPLMISAPLPSRTNKNYILWCFQATAATDSYRRSIIDQPPIKALIFADKSVSLCRSLALSKNKS